MDKDKLSACYRSDHTRNWIQTFTGRQVFPFRPEASEFVIADIAHHLAMICRFTGATRSFYSVAQHSVLVSQLVPPEHAKAGLLHDASEAYLCDIPSPIKPGIPDYKALERRLEEQIFKSFDLEYPEPPCVKRADMIAVATEARDLMANAPTLWMLPMAPMEGITIDPWSPEEAERRFLRRWDEITRSAV